MSLKRRLRKQLAKHEGFVQHAYQDSEGYWTIGFGRMIDYKLGGGITTKEAYVLLDNDIEKTYDELDRWYPWWRDLKEDAQLVIANMAFNMGMTRLSNFKNMLGALRVRDYNKAADEMVDSKWYTQVGNRAKELESLMRGCAE